MVPDVCKSIVDAYKDDVFTVPVTPENGESLLRSLKRSGMCDMRWELSTESI